MRSKPASALGALPDRYRARVAACTPPYGPNSPDHHPQGPDSERRPTGRSGTTGRGSTRDAKASTKPETYFRFLPTTGRVCTAAETPPGMAALGEPNNGGFRLGTAGGCRRSASYRTDTAPA